MIETINILESAAAYVQDKLDRDLPAKFVYHNINHTVGVVNAAKEIAVGNDLSPGEVEALLIAAWFHDIGYTKGPKDHEERSAKEAESFLIARNYPQDKIDLIKKMILSTKMPQEADNVLEEILCDADLSNLGKKSYFDLGEKLKEEWETTGQKTFTEESWLLLELDFLTNHTYHNAYAQELYNKRKIKNIKKLSKKLAAMETSSYLPEIAQAEKELKKGSGNRKNYGRGVETMFRATYRTHINLSAIADNKANIMLSINAIIISITLPNLVPQLSGHQNLIIPTFLLLATCVVSVIYATLSTRPKINEGTFSREDITQKRSNLLFFGNFYNMDLDMFEWGINEMMDNEDFLYGSMTRDLYYLGKVLAKKYKYLRICYSVFMYGLITTIVAFALAYSIPVIIAS
ncbi:MAG: Pycsar system effector family protein [Bacteroidota bacterium]